ncbi:MAG TPA: DUF4260 domain-containing protein [Patescibacteria group bacterium]
MVKVLLKIEGLIFLLLSLYFYNTLHGNWLIFALLLFTPDIFMLGYLINKKLGATIYNLGHTYVTSVVILLLGLFMHNNNLTLGSLIISAHIGMDRSLGYGLKYSTSFKDTHLQKA